MRMSKAEAAMLSLSAGLITFGTVAATVPDFVPNEVKVPVAVIAWLAGLIGFSAKKALKLWAQKRIKAGRTGGSNKREKKEKG